MDSVDTKPEEVQTVAHYRFSFRGVKLDPYRILHTYNITHPAQQHAIKKLLRAGCSVKTLEQDIDEVIMSLNRWKEMMREESQTEEIKIEEKPAVRWAESSDKRTA